MQPNIQNPIKPINLKSSLLIFGTAALLLSIITYVGIDLMQKITGIRREVLWFLNSGLFLFAPLFFLAIKFAKDLSDSSDKKTIMQFLRLNPMSKEAVWASVIGTLVVFILTGLLTFLLPKIIPGFSSHPPFLKMSALLPGEHWILLCWLPMFFFNIFGEELFWRGLILQGQEKAMGNRTWWIHGFCWMIFHIPFGIDLLLLLTPILFIQSYLVWKYKNTWIGIIIHGVVNGTGFLAVAFGLAN